MFGGKPGIQTLGTLLTFAVLKANIKQKSELALAGHIAAINKTLGKVTLPDVVSDFTGAMKNKRTIASLQDAVPSWPGRKSTQTKQPIAFV